ncbi:MAG: PAS domain S-box protein [Methanoregulaceae archaeon]|nr:PAS domain S-box protein [Methanoregulaceae archaeon]
MITVLLVHDNTDLIETTRLYLEKMGDVRVDVVNSTKHALEVLKNRSYDVIVSYYQIPEVNGIEFLADMSGVELLTYVKMQGLATPFILYSRRDRDKVVVEDINYAAEVAISSRAGRPAPVAELRDVIKQAVLRKRNERDLLVRCEMLAGILTASPLWICQVQNQQLTFVSVPMAGSLGYEEGALTGKQVAILFPDRQEYERAWREITLRIDPQGWGHADTALSRKDGSLCHGHLQVHRADPVDPQKGEIVVFEDTSSRKQLEEALKESELRYRELMQQTSSLVLKMDTSGTITFVNKAAQAFFGYSGPELVGKSIVGTLIPARSRVSHDLTSLVNDLGLNAGSSSIRINEMVLRSGDPVWIAWTNQAIRDEEGHIVEILCVGNDITDHDSHDKVRISTAMWKDRVIADTDVREEVFDAVFHISVEIAKEGREGKQVGTAFIVGDAPNVLKKSKQLILNPFEGHRCEDRMITSHELRENIKELAQLDGAFVVRGDGLIEAAARYITIDTSTVGIPKGLGTRHSSVAGITQATNAIGIVVSQSGGKISIFRNGRLVQEIS